MGDGGGTRPRRVQVAPLAQSLAIAMACVSVMIAGATVWSVGEAFLNSSLYFSLSYVTKVKLTASPSG